MPKEKNAKASEKIDSPAKLIAKLFSKPKDRKWAENKIMQSGPPHKQLQHTLVLKRLQKLIELVEASRATTLKPAPGTTLTTEEEAELPLPLPAESLKKIKNITALTEQLSAGPEHEILYTAILLQAIEFLISANQEAA